MAFTAAQLLQMQDVDKETTPQNVFGYYGFVVLSGSMADEFSPGDVIITKEVDPTTVQVGDIISFISVDPNSFGVVVTHKVRSITQLRFCLWHRSSSWFALF